MSANITIIFKNGSRETFNNVDDSIAWSKSKFTDFLINKYKNPNIMDTIVNITRDPPTRPEATTSAPAYYHGDKGRWEDLGTGYLHNLDTHERKLK